MPGNILLEKNESRLPRDSVINVSQIATIDKSWLEEKTGSISETLMDEVDFGLGLILGLN